MLTVYVLRGPALEPRVIEGEQGLPAGLPEAAVWLDLLNPTIEEDRLVEKLVGVAIPTRRRCRKSRFPAASISRMARVT